MSVMEQLEQASRSLNEKLTEDVEREAGQPQKFTEWTNGPGWGDFTRTMNRR